MRLSTPISELKRVGAVIERRLAVLGIRNVEQLLHHYPFRYEDFRALLPIAQVAVDENVTIRAKIELIANKRSPRKRTILTEAIVADESDRLRVIWFGQPFLTKTLEVGDIVYLSGKITMDRLGRQMVSPAYEKAERDHTAHIARIIPLYPLTKGVTQKQLRTLLMQVMDALSHLQDWLPEKVRNMADVMPLPEAIRAIHFPESDEQRKHAERRIKFDEVFVLQLRAEMLRQSLERSEAPAIAFHEEETKTFVSALPFTLTKDQKIAAWGILKDMEKSTPMNRLLEGDVGSGKTVVAAIALHNAALEWYQSVIMVPTEILAKQHFASLSGYLGKTHTIALCTSSELRQKKQREEFLHMLKEEKIQIVVGTHALLTEDVVFKNLGLVIVDEQHRFGVEQRKMIREKSGSGRSPHFLSMTATPIPRSFALTLYGDLDLSIIKELPPGRKPVKTRVAEPHHRQKAYAFIEEQLRAGRQAFVICPLIEESGSSQERKSVLAEYTRLSSEVFPKLRLAYLHGKMPPKEKDAVMQAFGNGKIDMLISTSVVEVGVNIPNASVMLIEGAEHFGLAQLHQFRGRVGRSDHQSYCFLFYEGESEEVKKRLAYFEKTTDGFVLAEYDLHMRGPGEVYGHAQSGMQRFHLATMRDIAIIKLARDIARGIDFEKYPSLRQKVEEWETQTHLE